MSMKPSENQPIQKKESQISPLQSWQEVADFARLELTDEQEVRTLELELNGLFFFEPETSVLENTKIREGRSLTQWRTDSADEFSCVKDILLSTHCREDGFFAVPVAVEGNQ